MRLVCDELIVGLTNLDSWDTLYRRLRSLPTDLEEFFTRMIKMVDPVYHAQCAQILLLVMAAKEPLALRSFDFLEEVPTFGIQKCPSYLPCSDEIRSTQIKARGADLIELVRAQIRYDKLGYVVMFIHRTVHDFLSKPEMQEFLIQKAPSDFNTAVYISQTLMVQIKLFRHWYDSTQATSTTRYALEHISHQLRLLELQNESVYDDIIDDLLPEIESLPINEYLNWKLPVYGVQDEALAVLTFAVHAGLPKFVARNLYLHPKQRTEHLLYFALFNPSENNAVMLSGHRSELVRLLLSKDGSPNQSMRGEQHNTAILQMLLDNFLYKRDDENIEQLGNIISVFLAKGACVPSIPGLETILLQLPFPPPQKRQLAQLTRRHIWRWCPTCFSIYVKLGTARFYAVLVRSLDQLFSPIVLAGFLLLFSFRLYCPS